MKKTTRMMKSYNPFKRRILEVEEFVITELSLYEFLDSLEALFDNDIDWFSLVSGIPPERARREDIIIKFIELHKVNDSKGKEGEMKFKDLEETIKTTWKLCVFLGELFGKDPLFLAREYTLNQLVLCLNEYSKEPEKGTKAKESHFKDKPIPSNARNYKEWIDKAGNKCRSWEVEI